MKPATTASPSTSTEGTSTSSPKSPPSALDFDGKYAVSLSAPIGSDDFATVGGFLYGEINVVPWTERTTDGGLSWKPVVSPLASGDLSFNNREDGWSVGGVRRLLRTTDGGRVWRAVAVDGDVGSLAVAGEATWLIEYRLVGKAKPACRTQILLSKRAGDLPAVVSSQPNLGHSCGTQIVAASPSTAYVVGASTLPATSYLVTTNGGASWRERSTPCSRLPSANMSLAAAGDSVWLRCIYSHALDTFGDHPAKAYRSMDAGRSWTRLTVPDAGENGSVLEVATPQLAWVWGDTPSGAGYLERTSNGGRTWVSMLTTLFTASGGTVGELRVRPLLRNVSFLTTTSFAAAGQEAAIAIEAYPTSGANHFVVGITRDGGVSWQWAYLANLGPRAG